MPPLIIRYHCKGYDKAQKRNQTYIKSNLKNYLIPPNDQRFFHPHIISPINPFFYSYSHSDIFILHQQSKSFESIIVYMGCPKKQIACSSKHYRTGIRNAWRAVKSFKKWVQMKQFRHRCFQHGQYLGTVF